MATYKGKTYGREPEASEEYLPLRPPEWIPDASAPACMAATDLGVACGRPFDAFLDAVCGEDARPAHVKLDFKMPNIVAPCVASIDKYLSLIHISEPTRPRLSS